MSDGMPPQTTWLSPNSPAPIVEDTARDGEGRHHAVFASMDVGYCLVAMEFDAAGHAVDYRFIELNPAFERHTGLVGALGRSMREIAPAHEQHWFDIYGKVALTGEPVRFENAAEALGRWYEVQAFRVGNPARHQVAILFNDISERRRVERDLRGSETRLRRLTETLEQQVAERTADCNRLWQLSTDLIMMTRMDGIVTAANPAWHATLGWTEAELVGSSKLDLVHPEDRAGTLERIADLVAGKTVQGFESRYRHRDGTYRWITWTAVPGDGFINAVGRDVSAGKEQRAALEQVEEALRQSHKMEAVGQLTGGIAHDFNNMLQAISGNMEMLWRRVEQGRTAEAARFLEGGRRTVERAAALTHRLLAFARRQALQPVPVNPDTLVEGMAELIRGTVGPAITVDLVLRNGDGPVLCDPNQLENALLNLAINARDAMAGDAMAGHVTREHATRGDDRLADGGDRPRRMTIATEDLRFSAADLVGEDEAVPGDYVRIAVTDTGSGMDEATMARVFEPFFTTKPLGQGTGLGLSQLYGFVRQSGGFVRLRSAPGQGTTVDLFLPRHRELKGTEAPGAAVPAMAQAGQTVLVVEDEPDIRALASTHLLELGYRVMAAGDASDALNVLRSAIGIDLLVTDVGLPGTLNGRQLADAARERWPGLPVLFITGYAGTALADQLAPGMELIGKPFSLDTLATRVQAVLARPHGDSL